MKPRHIVLFALTAFIGCAYPPPSTHLCHLTWLQQDGHVNEHWVFDGVEYLIKTESTESWSFGTYRVEIREGGNTVANTFQRDGYHIRNAYFFTPSQAGVPTVVAVFGNVGSGRYIDYFVAFRWDGEKLIGEELPLPPREAVERSPRSDGHIYANHAAWKEGGRLSFSFPMYLETDSMAYASGGRRYLIWDFNAKRWLQDPYHESRAWDSTNERWVSETFTIPDTPATLEPMTDKLLVRWPSFEGARTYTIKESDSYLHNPYALSYMAYGTSEYVPQIMAANQPEGDPYLDLSAGQVLTFPEIP